MNNLTNKAAARHFFNRRLTAAAVVKVARELAGGRYQVISHQAGCLKIGVQNYDEVTSLLLKKDEIINQINQRLGSEIVKEIKIVFGNLANEDY